MKINLKHEKNALIDVILTAFVLRRTIRVELSFSVAKPDQYSKGRRCDPTFFGAPSRIRTRGPQIRSLMLYPAELLARAHRLYALFLLRRETDVPLPHQSFSVGGCVLLSIEGDVKEVVGIKDAEQAGEPEVERGADDEDAKR